MGRGVKLHLSISTINITVVVTLNVGGETQVLFIAEY
jgi:hypothetical protein